MEVYNYAMKYGFFLACLTDFGLVNVMFHSIVLGESLAVHCTM